MQLYYSIKNSVALKAVACSKYLWHMITHSGNMVDCMDCHISMKNRY